MTRIFGLLVIFQLKHFLADYPLQVQWMLGKFRATGWVVPLLAHAAVHGAFTFIIALIYHQLWQVAVILGLFDLTIHFAMDRLKASPALLGRFKPLTAETFGTANRQLRWGNRLFWWSLGFDQMVHHLTDYLVIAYIVWE